MKVRMLNSKRAQAGFSLVELMIVVAIIGILATIAIPNFQRFQAKARQSEARNNLAAYYAANKATYSEWNTYIGNFVAIGFRPEGRLGYRVTSQNIAVMPTGYTGPTEAGCVTTENPAGNCTTPASDGMAWGAVWTETVSGSVVPAAAVACAVGTTSSTFLACASGTHNAAATADTWSINHTKVVANTNNGI